MAGMDRHTGAELDGLAHIKQSVGDIIGTRIGSVLTLRDYGSFVPDLIDQPMTPANVLRIFAATALALTRWEDRLRLRRVGLVAGDRPGAAVLTIDAVRADAPAANALVRLSVPISA